MKKRMLKKWVVKVLGFILGSWLLFIATTIDNVLENKTYDTILIIWSALAIGSFILLNKYSNAFDYTE